MKLVYTRHSKCRGRKAVGVRVSPQAQMVQKKLNPNKHLQAYLIGIALGDGNLSNPNGRATRLRITCDKKYPILLNRIKTSLEKLLPQNKVAIVNYNNYVDISCYSNYWENLIGWKAKGGSKIKQLVKIPKWVKDNKEYSVQCLKGLMETDGSIYMDRNYMMVNFVTYIPTLANDVIEIIKKLNFKPNLQKLKLRSHIKHTVRISKDAPKFIKLVNIQKG